MDLITIDDIRAEYGDDDARYVARHAYHADRDGRTYIDAETLDDLLTMHDLEGQR